MVCGKAQTSTRIPSTSVILTQEPNPLGEVLVGLLALWWEGQRGVWGRGDEWGAAPKAVLFSMSDRKPCGVSKYTGKLGILECKRQSGENKIVCFAKGIFK